jgi:hypothetical protein
MSQSDPKIAEQNRIAFNKDQDAKQHEQNVFSWLMANPKVGSLHHGKGVMSYYRYDDNNNYIEVQEFEAIEA